MTQFKDISDFGYFATGDKTISQMWVKHGSKAFTLGVLIHTNLHEISSFNENDKVRAVTIEQ